MKKTENTAKPFSSVTVVSASGEPEFGGVAAEAVSKPAGPTDIASASISVSQSVFALYGAKASEAEKLEVVYDPLIVERRKRFVAMNRPDRPKVDTSSGF